MQTPPQVHVQCRRSSSRSVLATAAVICLQRRGTECVPFQSIRLVSHHDAIRLDARYHGTTIYGMVSSAPAKDPKGPNRTFNDSRRHRLSALLDFETRPT